eukprot:609886-Rhodomonas_salina.3
MYAMLGVQFFKGELYRCVRGWMKMFETICIEHVDLIDSLENVVDALVSLDRSHRSHGRHR